MCNVVVNIKMRMPSRYPEYHLEKKWTNREVSRSDFSILEKWSLTGRSMAFLLNGDTYIYICPWGADLAARGMNFGEHSVSCVMLLLFSSCRNSSLVAGLELPCRLVWSPAPGSHCFPLPQRRIILHSFPVVRAPVPISIGSPQGCAPPAPMHTKSALFWVRLSVSGHQLSFFLCHVSPDPLHVAWAADTDTSSFFYVLNSMHSPCDGSLRSNQWSGLSILLR